MKGFGARRATFVICLLFVASLFFAFIYGCVPAPTDSSAEPPVTSVASRDSELDSLRELLKGFVDDGELPGVSLVLTQHGNIVFEEAFGWADIKAAKPFTIDTITWLGSTTKPFSATCVMILVDEGKLSLDDTVSKYIPAFGELTIRGTGAKAPSPTMRQLISHTSGMPGSPAETPAVTKAIRDFTLTMAEAVDLLAHEGLVAEPGGRFSYGGASFQVAGRVVEIVSGQPFDVFMQERLLRPLGMAETTFRPAEGQVPRIASIYQPASEGFKKSLASFHYLREINLTLVGGGLYSSLSDTAVFLQMHLNGGSYGSTQILSPAAVAEMQKVQTGNARLGYSPSRAGADYGLGWFIDRTGSDGQTLTVSHGGKFGSLAWVDIDRDLAGVFLTNMPYQSAAPFHREVQEYVLDIFTLH